MPITAGVASEKINELKSKLAIYGSWVELIHANYMPNDGGAPEVRITREDGGTATEAHFESVLEEIEEKCVELREELASWEGLVFEAKVAAVTPLHPQVEASAGKKNAQGRQPRRAQPAAK